MPQVGIDTSEDVMPIEVGDPLIAKCNFWQILKSTKFSEAPESKIWTGKLSNRPSTTEGLRLERALASYGFSIDDSETTALEGADLYPVFDWHTCGMSWFAAAETGSITSRTRVSRMKLTATKRTLFTWLLNHLFIHTSMCNSDRRTRRRRMVRVAISRIAKRCFRALTVNITLRVEGGRRQKLSRRLSHRQSLTLGSVQALS